MALHLAASNPETFKAVVIENTFLSIEDVAPKVSHRLCTLSRAEEHLRAELLSPQPSPLHAFPALPAPMGPLPHSSRRVASLHLEYTLWARETAGRQLQ